MTHTPMIQYVVYEKASDHPDFRYAVRRWGIAADTLIADEGPACVAVDDDGLEQIRDHFVEMGLVCLSRYPDDDPVILEVWV